jgi:predicted nucleic acid-binding protein
MKAVFDTNILIDYLNGVPQAATELGRYSDRLISRITWLEVLVGCAPGQEEATARAFLGGFQLVEVDSGVSEQAITVRRRPKKIRLPDALVLATAQAQGCPLVTRNTKDFPAGTPGVVVPYDLSPA